MYYVYLFPWKFHILSADRLSVRTRLTLIPTPPPDTNPPPPLSISIPSHAYHLSSLYSSFAPSNSGLLVYT